MSKMFEMLFNSNPQPTFILDAKSFRFLSANEAVSALYGFSVSELLKMTLIDVLAEEAVAPTLKTLESMSSDQVVIDSLPHVPRKGVYKPVELHVSTCRFKRKKALLVYPKEMTEASLRERELLAGFSHDLKNPLSVIIAYSDLIERNAKKTQAEDPATQKLRRQAESIRRSAERMTEMIDGALEHRKRG